MITFDSTLNRDSSSMSLHCLLERPQGFVHRVHIKQGYGRDPPAIAHNTVRPKKLKPEVPHATYVISAALSKTGGKPSVLLDDDITMSKSISTIQVE